MGIIRDSVFDSWWPLGQSLLLARASIHDTAKALEADGKRLRELCSQEYQYEWLKRSSIEDLLRNAGPFPNSPTRHYALPTKTAWTVIWNNSALCDGHDSFAHCLTHFWGIETLHFYSSDKSSIQLAGSHFTHRVRGDTEEMKVRDVYCCDQGGRWHFEQHGDPLPEEDLESYSAKRKRDRLNEQCLMELLQRLGIQPWRETTYDFAQSCFCMINAKYHPEGMDFKAIRSRLSKDSTRAEDRETEGPPDYLRGRCRAPNPNGPARLLSDGSWCGHGEERFWIFDVEIQGSDMVSVLLPARGSLSLVAVVVNGSDAVAVYDSRLHPASVNSESEAEPVFQPPLRCRACDSILFRASVGFEVPADYQSPNDTSWFILALECGSCGLASVAYEDETA